MPAWFPQGSHITRKRRVYYYRRRLPGGAGEVTVSLQTRQFREAEHRASMLDRAFDACLQRAKVRVSDGGDLNAILRGYLREFLDCDLERRMARQTGAPVYAYWWEPGDTETATEADLGAIRSARGSLARDLAENSPKEMEELAEELIRQHGLPDHLRRPLTYGLIEAAIRGWDVVEQRTLGKAPLVFDPTEPPSPPSAPESPVGTGEAPPKGPPASELVPAFAEWARTSGGWRRGGESQAVKSLGLFLECCGDRPIASYTHADGDLFRSTLRQLPVTYRKSPREKNRPLADLIAEARAKGAPSLTDKTVRRHFWAVSRFFAFLQETGRLPRGGDNPGRGFSFNTKGAVRKQRDMWTGEELRRLFTSPVWVGCHPYFRSQFGTRIIRDSLFWLPLLGLFHGNRLEEFAQLRREDVGTEDGVWYLHVTDDGDRQIKNDQSRRKVPLHPELIRIGFLEHVATTALHPKDRVFPDLTPGGADQKFGYGFSKRFSHYRTAIGLRRRGLDYHSFRHGVTTKLYEADVNEGWVDLLTGHASGGESRRRYLKGVRLSILRGAIENVRWPELDLSHRHVREAGDERWPIVAAQTNAA